MKNKKAKLPIYQGMIRYLLESTHYNLKTIADLSQCSVLSLRSIYFNNVLPAHFSEMRLVELYHLALGAHLYDKQTYEKRI